MNTYIVYKAVPFGSVPHEKIGTITAPPEDVVRQVRSRYGDDVMIIMQNEQKIEEHYWDGDAEGDEE